MNVRRVVTFTGPDGKARVQMDGPAPRSTEISALPGFRPTLIWSTQAGPLLGTGAVGDPTPTLGSFVPEAGGTRLMVVTFPPDSGMARPEFDPAAFGAQVAVALPGLAETFEPDHPGMHKTDSVDYDVVLDGEMVLELDDGQEVTLGRHDIVIQNGTRHAWRNRSDKPATMLFVLVGASRIRP